MVSGKPQGPKLKKKSKTKTASNVYSEAGMETFKADNCGSNTAMKQITTVAVASQSEACKDKSWGRHCSWPSAGPNSNGQLVRPEGFAFYTDLQRNLGVSYGASMQS